MARPKGAHIQNTSFRFTPEDKANLRECMRVLGTKTGMAAMRLMMRSTLRASGHADPDLQALVQTLVRREVPEAVRAWLSENLGPGRKK